MENNDINIGKRPGHKKRLETGNIPIKSEEINDKTEADENNNKCEEKDMGIERLLGGEALYLVHEMQIREVKEFQKSANTIDIEEDKGVVRVGCSYQDRIEVKRNKAYKSTPDNNSNSKFDPGGSCW
ncbi:hypothetical protein F8M41_014421 [Gigaspora margarita]|uniref:Uncharacterized protein n=1 Tax=Gigaspora margarita TaxID=4874 RepID=A0A8H4ARN2_GIGMA|nr:hypothetical protein F8M41_014421 [Gigaspora margarita]